MPVIREYFARPGARINDDDARSIMGHLDEKYGQDAEVTAEIFVSAARPARSPTHRYLEWDDAIAGAEYRLEQARLILRSIEVKTVSAGGEEQRTRAYEVVTPPGGGTVYAPIQTIIATPEYDEQVRDRFLREIDTLIHRYEVFERVHDDVLSLRRWRRGRRTD